MTETPVGLIGSFRKTPPRPRPRRRKKIRGKPPILPLLLLALFAACAIFAPLIAPYDPNATDLKNALQPPLFQAGGSIGHLLGTDNLGRDVLSRIIFGSRTSFVMALAVLTIAGVIGTVVGLVSGYVGGLLDAIIQRLVEGILSVPTLLVALVLAFIIGQGLGSMVIILTPFVAAGFTRMMRGEALALKVRGHVDLARVAGASGLRIIFRHILPSALGTLAVVATLQVGELILVSASLSFLGVGIAPPTADWGLMISQGREYLATSYWLSVFPGVALVLVVLSMNWMGDWLRDHFDPRELA